jgi:TrmH family RNA methyltransferase
MLNTVVHASRFEQNMKVKEIASAHNPLLQKIRRLDHSSDRKELGLFLIEGPKLIGEALSKNVAIVDMIASKSFFDSGFDRAKLGAIDTLTVVQDHVFKTLCTTDTSCSILATAKPRLNSLKDLLTKKGTAILLGERIQDPGNLGTIIRTALAFDAAGLILTAGSVDYLSPKVVRSSMGAVFSLPIVAEQDLATSLSQLKDRKIRLVALDAKGGQTLETEKQDRQTAYLFGNEGQGLSAEALEQADEVVSIPISSATESLNVAVAVGLVLYHARSASER